MSKGYTLMEHTADVGVEAMADTLDELYEALALGLAEVVYDRAGVRPLQARELAVDAVGADREALAVDFLTRLLTMLEADRFLFAEVRVTVTPEGGLTARLEGERIDLSRHEIRTEVKAITYHMLKVEKQGPQWYGRVILDL